MGVKEQCHQMSHGKVDKVGPKSVLFKWPMIFDLHGFEKEDRVTLSSVKRKVLFQNGMFWKLPNGLDQLQRLLLRQQQRDLSAGKHGPEIEHHW